MAGFDPLKLSNNGSSSSSNNSVDLSSLRQSSTPMPPSGSSFGSGSSGSGGSSSGSGSGGSDEVHLSGKEKVLGCIGCLIPIALIVGLIFGIVNLVRGCTSRDVTPAQEQAASAETPAEPEQAEQVNPVTGFEGREARDASELASFVSDADELAISRRNRMADDHADDEESELIAACADDFERANELYRDGSYTSATRAYEAILTRYPLHYGANVNLALAYLQNKQPEEGLKQALTALALFPGDENLALNVQVAGVACGFSAEDAWEKGAAKVASSLPDPERDEARYNVLWDRIETQLYDAAQGEGENDSATNRDLYANLTYAIASLRNMYLSDDPDLDALEAYLYYVGVQLGYEDYGPATVADRVVEAVEEATGN